MKKMLGCLVIGVVFVMSIRVVSNADSPSDERSAIDRLRSKDSADWSEAREQIRQQQKQLVDDLLDIAQQEDTESDPLKRWRSPKRIALDLLGELRPDDPQVTRAIAASLTYEVKPWYGGIDSSADMSLKYPAVGALVRIGHPALEHAWYRVEMSDDPLERELYTWIIGHVEGGDTARLLIEHKIANADPKKKKRYEAARSLLEETP